MSGIQSQDVEQSENARLLPEQAEGISAEEMARRRYERVAKEAYRRAEQRGFQPGGEVDDWLSAERELDAGGGSKAD